jgi:MFS family permease
VGQKVRLRHAPPLLAAGLLSLLPLYFFLLMGDLAWSLKERAVQEVVKAQLREFSQNPVLLNVLFGALPAMLSLLFGPLVGAWSDRTRTRLGRRIPFLLCGAPLIAASLVGLAYSEALADAVVAWFGIDPAFRRETVIACMGAFWALFELLSITSNALFIALVNDTVPKPMLGRFFGLFRIVSLTVGAGFFYFVFRAPLAEMIRPALLAVGAVYVGGFLLLCWRIREPAAGDPAAGDPAAGDPAAAPAVASAVAPAVAPAAAATAGHYGYLFLGLALAALAHLLINVNAYNARAQFGVGLADYGAAIAATYAVSILLALPLGWLSDHVHPLYLGMGALAAHAVAMLAAALLVNGHDSFLVALVLHGVLSGAFLSGTAALLPALLPRSRFSELATLSASISSLLTVIGSVAMGVVLDAGGRDYHWSFLGGGLAATAGCLVWCGLLRQIRGGVFPQQIG